MSLSAPASGWCGLLGDAALCGDSCRGHTFVLSRTPVPLATSSSSSSSLPGETSQASLVLQLMQLEKSPGQRLQRYLENCFQFHCLLGANRAAGGLRETLSLS